MTKLRAPLSIDAALARVAGQIDGGWRALADICARGTGRQVAERTVRNWGDPDTPEALPIDCAIALDIAFQAAGGESAPIFETYALQLEIARSDTFSSQFELARRAMAVIREGGEAHEALVRASLPGATAIDRANALREAEEAIAELKKTLPHLIEGAGPNGSVAGGTSLGGDNR